MCVVVESRLKVIAVAVINFLLKTFKRKLIVFNYLMCKIKVKKDGKEVPLVVTLWSFLKAFYSGENKNQGIITCNAIYFYGNGFLLPRKIFIA